MATLGEYADKGVWMGGEAGELPVDEKETPRRREGEFSMGMGAEWGKSSRLSEDIVCDFAGWL